MHSDDPKPFPEPPADEARTLSRTSFDLRALATMGEDEADAEWLRHPEAWHLH